MARSVPKSVAGLMTVGDIARRAGVAVSTVHFYEARGLIRSHRTGGNQRRFERHMLRRIGLIKVAQNLGIPLAEIGEALRTLPADAAPTKADWARFSALWRRRLDDRIARLTRLSDLLDGCIGCGCLSMERCPLYNPEDRLAAQGAGPRTLDP